MLSSIKYLVLIFFGISLFLFFKPQTIDAYALCDDEYRGCSLAPCSSCNTPDPGICSISASGACNACTPGASSDCCSSGTPWTKYKASCRLTDPLNNYCDWRWVYDNQVCSTADKCTSTSNNPYLNAGACDCSTGGVYKTCCNSNGSLSTNSCTQQSIDATNPPFEGTCPAGKITMMCGVDAEICTAIFPDSCTPKACGVSACCTLASAPVCNSGIVCSDTCEAPSDSCSPSNGTKSCKYTSFSGSNPCNKACQEVATDSQPCFKNTCSYGCPCSNGICVCPTPTSSNHTPTPTSGVNPTPTSSNPTPTSTLTPTPTPTPTQYNCNISISSTTSNSGTAQITESNNNFFGGSKAYDRTNWRKNGVDLGTNTLLQNTYPDLQPGTYIASAQRWSSRGLGSAVPCGEAEINITTLPLPQGSWIGSCKGGTTYHISGPPNTMTCAIRSGDSFPPGSGFFWQGKSTGSAGQVDIPITASQNFTWYSGDCSGNGSGATQRGTGYCETGSNPVYDPGYVGIIGEFNYPDGLPYDGFGLNGQGIPIYYSAIDASAEAYVSQCDEAHDAEYTVTLDGTIPPLIHIVRAEYDNPSYAIYEWKITKAGYSYIGLNDYQYGRRGVTASGNDPQDLYRFLWPKFPANFHVTRSWGGNGYERTSCESNGYTRGSWLYDVQYPAINNNLSAFKFGWGLSLLGAGQYPTINFTVRPPVTLTIIKSGQGTVTGAPVSNLETITQTREGYSLIDEEGYWIIPPDPRTLTASCSPGNTITSYSSTYGDGANGSSPRGGCGNRITDCGTCTKRATSCTNTYTHAICGHDDNNWCADAKLSINCAPPSITLTSATTSQAYYKTSSDASQNTRITLTATPTNPYEFAGWSSPTGDCSGNNPICTVLMDSNRTVTANFILPPPPPKTLTVKRAGTSLDDGSVSGYVSDNPTPIIDTCVSAEGCKSSFNYGTLVTLIPTYDPLNTIFTGWKISPSEPRCIDIGNCQVTMDKNKTVTATFNSIRRYLKTTGGDVHSNQ